MKVLDLFSGIGGFSLGLERAGMETVAFCEQDKFCQQVLAKHWPDVPCFDDVRALKGEDVGAIDLISGGYPCQPFSLAGKREGQNDDRHLWPEMHRLVATIRPRWVIAENVAGHINMGLDDVLSDLEGEGYTCWPLVIPACAVDAPHRRDRVWIVANDDSKQRSADKRKPNAGANGRNDIMGLCENVANAESVNVRAGFCESGAFAGKRVKPAHDGGAMADAPSPRSQGQTGAGLQQGEPAGNCRWLPEPGVGRVAHGIPRRVDRLKGLGNSVVPQIPEMIGRAIMAAHT